MAGDGDSATELAALVAKRGEAQRRVDELEAEQRAAGVARAEARAQLVEAERRGVRASERAKLERMLDDAERRPSVLGARIEGARHARRDCDAEVARHVGEHLTELVAGREQAGEAAVADLNAAAEALVAAYERREAIAAEISQLASMVGAVQPGDVSRSRSEAIARAAADLLRTGGETAPTLDRDPREPKYGTAPVAAA